MTPRKPEENQKTCRVGGYPYISIPTFRAFRMDGMSCRFESD